MSAIVEPVASVDVLLNRWWRPLQEIKEKLLESNDLLSLPGRDHPFIKKSGYRKYATAFGLSDAVIWQECERNSENPDEFTWRIRVRVTAPNGRYAEAVGAASTKERKFAHPEHDIFAMAHTRAKSRGISDLVGGGADVAEDLEGQDFDDRRPTVAPKGAPATGTATGTRGEQSRGSSSKAASSDGGRSPATQNPPGKPQEKPRSATYFEPYGAKCPKCDSPLELAHVATGIDTERTYVRCPKCGVVEASKVPPKAGSA